MPKIRTYDDYVIDELHLHGYEAEEITLHRNITVDVVACVTLEGSDVQEDADIITTVRTFEKPSRKEIKAMVELKMEYEDDVDDYRISDTSWSLKNWIPVYEVVVAVSAKIVVFQVEDCILLDVIKQFPKYTHRYDKDEDIWYIN